MTSVNEMNAYERGKKDGKKEALYKVADILCIRASEIKVLKEAGVDSAMQRNIDGKIVKDLISFLQNELELNTPLDIDVKTA